MLKREEITRDRVDRLVAVAQKSGPFQVLTHEERDANRKNFLKLFPKNEDLWVFGYGSLIWNPAFHFEEKQKARIYGFLDCDNLPAPPSPIAVDLIGLLCQNQKTLPQESLSHPVEGFHPISRIQRQLKDRTPYQGCCIL